MSFGDEERMAYEDRLKWLMIEANTLEKYEEKGFERGLEEGIEIGRKEKEEAIEKAKEKAQQEKIETAKVLLAQGIDAETIAKAMKLSQEEVKKLKP
jgi:predicted transposase YdaD